MSTAIHRAGTVTFVRRASTVLALGLCFSAGPANSGGDTLDPEAALKQLGLTYLQSGGDPQAVQQQLESQLEGQLEANVKSQVQGIALDFLDLAGNAALPGAGEAVSSLLGLFGGGGSGGANNQAFALINQRLTKLEASVSALNQSVDKLNIKVAMTANNSRVDRVNDVRTDLTSLTSPLVDKSQKQIADDALASADKLLATSGTDVWEWDNITIKPGGAAGPQTQLQVPSAPSINLALEPYIQSLALFVSARKAAGLGIDANGDPRVKKHIAFLTGTSTEAASAGLKYSLLQKFFAVSCKWSLDGAPNYGGSNSVIVYCSNSAASKTYSLQIDTPTQAEVQAQYPSHFFEDSALNDVIYGHYRPDIDTAMNSLTCQVYQADPVSKVIWVAQSSLAGHGSSCPSPSPYPTSSTPSSASLGNSLVDCADANGIFAADPSGVLHSFVDQTCKVDTWATQTSGSRLSPGVAAALKGDTRISPIGTSSQGGTAGSGGDFGYHPSSNGSAAGGMHLDRTVGSMGPLTYKGPSSSGAASKIGDAKITGAIHSGVTAKIGLNVARYRTEHSFSEYPSVGSGWGSYSAVVPGQAWPEGSVVYGLTADGAVVWLEIPASASMPLHKPQLVQSGWGQKKNIFSTGEGVLYGVEPNGDLTWNHHVNNHDGMSAPQWQQHPVGNGWGSFSRLFSIGQGIIYAVKPDGTLLWYRHIGYADGTKVWSGPKQVGNGWNGFKFVFGAPHGAIYAVNQQGELLFYKHNGWQSGDSNWEAPVKLADGWDKYSYAFASLADAQAEQPGPLVK